MLARWRFKHCVFILLGLALVRDPALASEAPSGSPESNCPEKITGFARLKKRSRETITSTSLSNIIWSAANVHGNRIVHFALLGDRHIILKNGKAYLFFPHSNPAERHTEGEGNLYQYEELMVHDGGVHVKIGDRPGAEVKLGHIAPYLRSLTGRYTGYEHELDSFWNDLFDSNIKGSSGSIRLNDGISNGFGFKGTTIIARQKFHTLRGRISRAAAAVLIPLTLLTPMIAGTPSQIAPGKMNSPWQAYKEAKVVAAMKRIEKVRDNGADYQLYSLVENLERAEGLPEFSLPRRDPTRTYSSNEQILEFDQQLQDLNDFLKDDHRVIKLMTQLRPNQLTLSRSITVNGEVLSEVFPHDSKLKHLQISGDLFASVINQIQNPFLRARSTHQVEALIQSVLRSHPNYDSKIALTAEMDMQRQANVRFIESNLTISPTHKDQLLQFANNLGSRIDVSSYMKDFETELTRVYHEEDEKFSLLESLAGYNMNPEITKIISNFFAANKGEVTAMFLEKFETQPDFNVQYQDERVALQLQPYFFDKAMEKMSTDPKSLNVLGNFCELIDGVRVHFADQYPQLQSTLDRLKNKILEQSILQKAADEYVSNSSNNDAPLYRILKVYSWDAADAFAKAAKEKGLSSENNPRIRSLIYRFNQDLPHESAKDKARIAALVDRLKNSH